MFFGISNKVVLSLNDLSFRRCFDFAYSGSIGGGGGLGLQQQRGMPSQPYPIPSTPTSGIGISAGFPLSVQQQSSQVSRTQQVSPSRCSSSQPRILIWLMTNKTIIDRSHSYYFLSHTHTLESAFILNVNDEVFSCIYFVIVFFDFSLKIIWFYVHRDVYTSVFIAVVFVFSVTRGMFSIGQQSILSQLTSQTNSLNAMKQSNALTSGLLGYFTSFHLLS